jgi:hypothetical protein
MRNLRRLFLALTLAIAAATPALADAPSLVPGSRIVKTFDFEERALNNFESVPMFWAKVAGHGYPAYANGRFDTTVFRSPANSFKLEIDGGSAAFQYSPGKLAINPSADYYVLAFVKTTALQHARAQISAWFADKDGKLLLESGMHSQAYASPAEKAGEEADWHVLHLYIPGARGGEAAKSLVLQVGLLQPQQLAGAAAATNLGKFALYQQDIKGAAWFDDIVVIQLPRLSVAVPATVPANVFAPGQQVDLDLTVSDVPTAAETEGAKGGAAAHVPPAATVRITDPDGLLYGSETFTATASDKDPWTHRYTHAPLPPGLYTATLDVTDKSAGGPGTLIARRQTKFACLAAPFVTLPKPATEFGFTLPPGSTGLWSQLQPLLRHTQAGLLQIPAWRHDMTEDGLLRRDPQLDSLLAMLQRLNIRVMANFSEMPAALSAKLAEARAKKPATTEILPPTDSVLALFDADVALWRPYVSFLLARYANRIDWWEFGSPTTPYSGLISDRDAGLRNDARYPKLYAKTSPELATMLNQGSQVVPWNALFEFDPKQYPGAGLDLRLPAAIKPSQIPAYLENFRTALSANAGATGKEALIAHLDPLDEESYERLDRLADFAQRVVYARTANPTAILVDLPVSNPLGGPGGTGAAGERGEPNELLLVYRTLVAGLGNSRFVREIPLVPGIKGFLFERSGGAGTLVLWNESASEPRVHLDLPLGASPRITNVWGVPRALAADPATEIAGVNVGVMPVIIDQIDSKMLQLRASFGLGAKTFPSGAGAVRTKVVLTNPYDETLAGSLKVSLPQGWSMIPPSVNVVLKPGATLQQPVTIRYPYSQLAGSSAVEGKLVTDSGRRFDFWFPITVSSDVVELDSSSQFLANGDLVVQEVITNIGQTPLNAQAYAQVPGYPRQQRYLLELGTGQTTIKRFVFPMSSFTGSTKATTARDIAAALVGKTASVGLKQNDGRTLINKSLPLQ